MEVLCFKSGTDEKCEYELGKTYKIEITPPGENLDISFKATDSSGNTGQCRFSVTVKGKLLRCNFISRLIFSTYSTGTALRKNAGGGVDKKMPTINYCASPKFEVSK